jgi:DNA polymerase III delta prime subunit
MITDALGDPGPNPILIGSAGGYPIEWRNREEEAYRNTGFVADWWSFPFRSEHDEATKSHPWLYRLANGKLVARYQIQGVHSVPGSQGTPCPGYWKEYCIDPAWRSGNRVAGGNNAQIFKTWFLLNERQLLEPPWDAKEFVLHGGSNDGKKATGHQTSFRLWRRREGLSGAVVGTTPVVRHQDIERLIVLMEETKQVILYGPPGTGKTLLARDCIAKFEKEGGGSCSEFVTFHQSFAYEEFVEGIRPSVDGSGQVQYDVRPGVFRRICERASADPDKKYLLVIDELNRGNIAKIMGELITLIEKDKRLGAENELEVTLPYSGDRFGVPSNLYILGTMNTADRSIALLDAAIRRRFSFIECPPDPSLLAGEKVDGIDLQKLLSNINERVSWLIDRDHRIGHSYLMGISDLSQLKRAWEQQIMPLLNEYFYNSLDRLEAVVGRGTFLETKAMTPKTRDALQDFVDDGDEALEPKMLNDEDFLAVMRGLSS